MTDKSHDDSKGFCNYLKENCLEILSLLIALASLVFTILFFIIGNNFTNSINKSNELNDRLNQNLVINNSSLNIIPQNDGLIKIPSANKNIKVKFTTKKFKVNSGQVSKGYVAHLNNKKSVDLTKIDVSQNGKDIKPINFYIKKKFNYKDDISYFFIFIDKNNNALVKFVTSFPSVKFDINKHRSIYNPDIFIESTKGKHLVYRAQDIHVLDISDVLDKNNFDNKIDKPIIKTRGVLTLTKLDSDDVIGNYQKIMKYLKDKYIIN